MTEERQRGDVYNTFSGTATYVVQGRDIRDIHLHAAPGETAQDRVARELARVVHAQWRDEAGVRGLSGSGKLAVRWSADWTVADHRDNVGAELSGSANGLADLAAAFRALPERRLVVLGEPGSGKTSLAILLALELLRSLAEGGPVPVVLLASSWEPGKEHFDAWVARRVHQEYAGQGTGLDRDRIRELVRDRRILPVVDGLDELPSPVRVAALTALNDALTDGAALILTSRVTEYIQAVSEADVVRGATVIRAQPVAARAGVEYLRQTAHPHRLERWSPVRTELADHPGGPLATALTSPLMLWLARTVYAHPGADPAELADHARFADAAAIERHLLDSLVPAVFPGTPPSPDQPLPIRNWGARRAQRWLGFLAAHLNRLRTKELTWWELHRARLPTALKLPVLVGLFVLLVIGVRALNDWITGPDPLLGFSVAVGVLEALASSLAVAMLASFALTGKGDLPRRPTVPFGPWTASLPILAKVVIVLSPVAVLVSGGQSLRVTGIVLAVLVVLLLGVPANTAQAVGPRRLLRGEHASVLVTILLVSPLTGILAAIPMAGTPGAMEAVWLIGSLTAAVVVLARSTWSRWLLAKVALAGTGRLPWSVLRFLEDARRAGVLRQVGGVYQFRHARLQARLAASWTGAGAPSSRPVPAQPDTAAGNMPPEVRITMPGPTPNVWSTVARYVALGAVATGLVVVWAYGEWNAVGFGGVVLGSAFTLGTVLSDATERAVRRKRELRLDSELIECTNGKRSVSLLWRDVDRIAVLRREPAELLGNPMLHVRLLPNVRPEPQVWVNKVGWIAFWPVEPDGMPSPELDRALRHFAGDRWIPPEPDED